MSEKECLREQVNSSVCRWRGTKGILNGKRVGRLNSIVCMNEYMNTNGKEREMNESRWLHKTVTSRVYVPECLVVPLPPSLVLRAWRRLLLRVFYCIK